MTAPGVSHDGTDNGYATESSEHGRAVSANALFALLTLASTAAMAVGAYAWLLWVALA